MEAVLGIALLFAFPALIVAGLSASVARLRGHDAGHMFWVAFLIMVGLEVVGVGMCLYSVRNMG